MNLINMRDNRFSHFRELAISLKFYGKKIKLRLKDWTARIFQHEIDHLNGELYIDKLTARENFWTEEEFEALQEEAAQKKQEKEVEAH